MTSLVVHFCSAPLVCFVDALDSTVRRLRSIPSRSRSSCLGVGDGVAGPTAAVPVGQCGGAILAIGRQHSPYVAITHPQDLSGLAYR